MIFGTLLAGGIGKRMGTTIPKQFLEIGGKSIILIALEKMIRVNEIDIIYIAIHRDWEAYLLALIKQANINLDRIRIVIGGNERIDTIENVITAINHEFTIGDDDVIVIHEAVRPFVTPEVITDSIQSAQEYGVVVAAIPATDTMLLVEDKQVISMPDRKKLFHGQAPDTCKIHILTTSLEKLTPDERMRITGTSQICMMVGYPVYTIPGSPRNIKITTDNDLKVADAWIKEEAEQ